MSTHILFNETSCLPQFRPFALIKHPVCHSVALRFILSISIALRLISLEQQRNNAMGTEVVIVAWAMQLQRRP